MDSIDRSKVYYRVIVYIVVLVLGITVGNFITLYGFKELVFLISNHLGAAGFGGGALLIATITSWPKKIPENKQDVWDWVRMSFQTAIPARQPVHDREQDEKEINKEAKV